MEYTIGEFAKQLGVSKRTLYYYDQIELFCPSQITKDGHRIYTDQDIIAFQKIVTLKYIGFSLEEIEKIINADDNMLDSMIYQRNKLESKRMNLNAIIDSIDDMINHLNEHEDINWNTHNEIIKIINSEQDWRYESQNIVNLMHRKRLYDLYSKGGNQWKSWVFDNIDFEGVTEILELGCGDGTFWKENSSRIPQNLNLTISDISLETIEIAKENLANIDYKIEFKVIDMMNIPYKDNSVDLIFIEHALYLSLNIERTISEIYRVLKPNGKLYITVISNQHLKELHKIVWDFSELTMSGTEKIAKFCLENGNSYFENNFNFIDKYERLEYMEVDDPKPLVNYVISCGDAHLSKMSIKDKNKLTKYVDKIINEEGIIKLTNYNGLLEFEKRKDE